MASHRIYVPAVQRKIAARILAQIPDEEQIFHDFESVLDVVEEEGLESYYDFCRYTELTNLSEWHKDMYGRRLNLSWNEHSLAQIRYMAKNYYKQYYSEA